MPVTVWIYHGLEGWTPKDFKNETEAIFFIKSGEALGQIRITREVKIFLDER